MFTADRLSLGLSGLRRGPGSASARPAEGPARWWEGDPRADIAWAASLGYAAVQLDATAPGVRPRELDRSARRDLASIMRRHGLACSGLDAFIPPSHFSAAEHSDRAAGAARAAIELAAELALLLATPASRVVCVELPAVSGPGILDDLRRAADREGVVLADLAWPPRQADEPICPGLDAASCLLAGEDPVAQAASAPFAAYRLADVAHGRRAAVGSPGGRLDAEAFLASVAVTGFSGRGHVVADIRDVPDTTEAARAALRAVPKL